MFSNATNPGYSTIVIPDDILKFPYAACSQQAIVMMEVLKRKGFKVRKVGLEGKMGRHFCFEVFYDGSWHFFDINKEPDDSILKAYNYPDVEFLTKRPDILIQAYNKYPKEQILDLFSTYHYGETNAPPAPRAYVLHIVTKFLSYTLWIFSLLIFIWASKKILDETQRTELLQLGVESGDDGLERLLKNPNTLCEYSDHSR